MLRSTDLGITIDTFYWLLLSNSSLSQSEALLNKSRFALLECAIHVFISVSQCPSLQQKGGQNETLLNTCIAHSNSADLLLSNNASDWLSEDFNKSQ